MASSSVGPTRAQLKYRMRMQTAINRLPVTRTRTPHEEDCARFNRLLKYPDKSWMSMDMLRMPFPETDTVVYRFRTERDAERFMEILEGM